MWKENSSISIPLTSPEENKENEDTNIKDSQLSIFSESEGTFSTTPESISNEFDFKYSQLKEQINKLIEVDRKRFADLVFKNHQRCTTSRKVNESISSLSHTNT